MFVGGLSPDTSKEDVEEALADYGIVSAKIMTRMGSEKPRGFAFAYFDTVKSAQLVAKIKWFKILVSATDYMGSCRCIHVMCVCVCVCRVS